MQRKRYMPLAKNSSTFSYIPKFSLVHGTNGIGVIVLILPSDVVFTEVTLTKYICIFPYSGDM